MKNVTVFYDNWCPNCNNFKNLITKLDWLKLIDFKELRNVNHLFLYDDIDLILAKKQMASRGGNWVYGYDSIFNIFSRIPLLWLLFPIFYLLKITGTGQYLYEYLAINRRIIPMHCNENSCEI